MKKSFYILLILGIMSLNSCSNNEENTNNNSSLILGKWKLTSKIVNYNGTFEEDATICQLAHFQFEFKTNNVLISKQVSDDPLLNLSNCNPETFNNTYILNNNNQLSLFLVTENNNETVVTITELTSNTFIFKLYENNGIDNIIWKFTKI